MQVPTFKTIEPAKHWANHWASQAKYWFKEDNVRTSPEFQWLRLHASTAGGTDLVPGWGTKIPHAVWCGQKTNKQQQQQQNQEGEDKVNN